MLVPIQTDMPLKVILEIFELPGSLHVEPVHDALKNIRQQIFPSKGEGRGYRTQIAAVDDFERLLHKMPSRYGDCRRSECCLNWNAPAKITEKSINASGVGPALFHRAMIKLEMAGDSASAIIVGFLGKHDLVDEAARLLIAGGEPRHFDAAESSLQHFEQRHEIPHSEDVVFHEQSQRIHAINFAVDAMVEQGLPQRI